MKALVFTEPAGNYPEDGTQVTSVVLVPNSAPNKRDMQSAYNEFIIKKMKRFEGTNGILKNRTNDGAYTQPFMARFEKYKRAKKLDIENWVLSKYKGHSIIFEEL